MKALDSLECEHLVSLTDRGTPSAPPLGLEDEKTVKNFWQRIDPDSEAAFRAMVEVVPDGKNKSAAERRAELDAMFESQTEAPTPDGVEWVERTVTGPDGTAVLVRIYTPADIPAPRPALIHIHGGGMWLGSVQYEHPNYLAECLDLGVVIIAVDYRLAPEHPYPAALHDCAAAIEWTIANASELAIDPERICVRGQSAGGGLALGTALLLRDRGAAPVRLLMAQYPMIDDRGETSSSHEVAGLGRGVWDREANSEAWEWYLAGQPADQYAAPARAENLEGLPPTFIDVGEVDLFRDEDMEFASRLTRVGVPTEFHLYPGAYHASEGVAVDAPLSRLIISTRRRALERALGLAAPTK